MKNKNIFIRQLSSHMIHRFDPKESKMYDLILAAFKAETEEVVINGIHFHFGDELISDLPSLASALAILLKRKGIRLAGDDE